MEKKINYKRLGLKCGLEIHQQLDTQHKLFCNCSTKMAQRQPVTEIKRKQHPVASELGEVDVAAQYEYLRDRAFCYQTFQGETCLVEMDSEPPHELNPEALRIAIEIALLLNCQIPNELHVMRKTITDGSNTSAFQRTLVVGLNGFLRYKGKKIGISHVSLEEDAAGIVKEEAGTVTYRLNRLAVPLVEIGTGLLVGYSPEQVQEIGYLIGIICRSTDKVKHGIGSIRQDVNVSIRRGARVEIKGVQELGLIGKVIEKEVERQLSTKVKKETRAAKPDGSTRYTRPLPGAARMYPETDIPPVIAPKQLVKEIRAALPEPWTKKLARFKKIMSKDLAMQMLRSDRLELFEKIVKRYKINASIVASTFVSLLKELRRDGVRVEALTDKHFTDMFSVLARKKIVKEAIPELLKHLAEHPSSSVSSAVQELDLKVMSKRDLNKVVREVVAANPELKRDKIFGIVMSRVRGRADAAVVDKAVKRIKRK